MPLLDTVSTGLPPELVHALNDSVTATNDTGSPVRALYAAGATIVVYVDSVDGDDSNDGLKQSTPLKTIEQVYRAVASAAVGGARIVVNLAGPSTGTSPREYPIRELIFQGHAFRGPEMILAPVSTATAALDVAPATAQTNRTRLNFTTAAPAWASNELRGYFVRIKRNGALQFPELPIAGNDADRIYVNTASLASDVLATDTVEIVRPGAKIVGTNSDFGFDFLQLQGQSGTSFAQYCCLERVELSNFASLSPDAILQMDRVRTDSPDFGLATGRFAFVNTIVNGPLDVMGTARNADAFPRENYATGKFVDLLIVGGGLTVGGDDGNGCFAAKYDVSVYNNANGAGITCVSPGSFFVAASSNATVQGSGNLDVGILARRGGRVTLQNTASKTSITGTAGDLKVGNGAAVAYGTGAGQFRQVAGWNGNLTRVLEGTATAPTGDTSQIECIF